jgi:hypothetical protein
MEYLGEYMGCGMKMEGLVDAGGGQKQALNFDGGVKH